jgi:hypothetical protein
MPPFREALNPTTTTHLVPHLSRITNDHRHTGICKTRGQVSWVVSQCHTQNTIKRPPVATWKPHINQSYQ